MKKNILLLFAVFMMVSCNNGKNVTIFEIGDSRDDVINTMVNDFTIQGEHWSKDKIIQKEHSDSEGMRTVITLYECVYKGQEYNKVRVYFDLSGKICRMEFKIEKDKMKNMHKRLKTKYGDSRRANLPSGLPGLPPLWEIYTVYLGDIDGIVVTEKNDVYELIVVSGEQYYELKRYL